MAPNGAPPLDPTAQAEFNHGNAILGKRAFRMGQKLGDLLWLLCFYIHARTTGAAPTQMLRTIRGWILAPFTLWPVDFNGLGRFVTGELAAGRELDREIQALLYLCKDHPSQITQDVIGDYEHRVHQGAYDSLLRDNTKYELKLKELIENPEYHSDWALVKSLYDITKFQTPDTKKILRRTPVMERNIRHNFDFRWTEERERFHRVFDCFCTKHNLYGMEGEKPLLMKVTLNPTPDGLMLFIPSWMSFNIWHDLVHSVLSDLQRCRGVMRQGPVFSEKRLEKQEIGKQIIQAEKECATLNLRGEKKLKYILEKVGLPPKTNERTVRKYRDAGYEALAAENTEHDRLAALVKESNSPVSPKDEQARRVALADSECKANNVKGPRRRQYIIEKAKLPENISDRQIGRLRDHGAALLESDAEVAAITSRKMREAAEGNPGNTAKLAQAKAMVAGLSAEEKAELMKWMKL